MDEDKVLTIEPQEGYQMKVLSSPADIVVSGASAGVGKTFALLLEPVRYIDNPDFGGVIFRRTSPQIRAEGGLWDTSESLYPYMHAEPKESSLQWVFESGAKMKFSHLEHEKNVLDWQGSQIPFIAFDELTHFTKKMFFYLLSRNRSACGVKPFVRATCNPDPESWVYDLIKWYIDEDSGFPIPERDGVVRYFVAKGDGYIWADTREECIKKAWHIIEPVISKSDDVKPEHFVKSFSFISGDIYDNKALLKTNPEYLANLLSQDDETKAQLLDGNWKVVLSDVDLYDYFKFKDLLTNTQVKQIGEKYLTCDVALKGSDKLIIFVWHGRTIIGAKIMNKSDGAQVIDAINEMKVKFLVPNSNITFDNDGVGGFVDGFIKGAKEFKNGSRALNDENYKNLKTQCYYKSAESVYKGEIYITPEVASQMYDKSMTIAQRLMYERKAIKRFKPDEDGRLQIIPKSEMKTKLNGSSPDLLDGFMMREIFDLKPPAQTHITKKSLSSLGI